MIEVESAEGERERSYVRSSSAREASLRRSRSDPQRGKGNTATPDPAMRSSDGCPARALVAHNALDLNTGGVGGSGSAGTLTVVACPKAPDPTVGGGGGRPTGMLAARPKAPDLSHLILRIKWDA